MDFVLLQATVSSPDLLFETAKLVLAGVVGAISIAFFKWIDRTLLKHDRASDKEGVARDREIDAVWQYIRTELKADNDHLSARIDALITKTDAAQQEVNHALFNAQLEIREFQGFSDTLRDIMKRSLVAGLAPPPAVSPVRNGPPVDGG